MTKYPHIIKVLDILSDDNKNAKHSSVLTYLCSDVAKEKLEKQMDYLQFIQLCKLLVRLVSKPNIQGNNTNNIEEPKKALEKLLENFAHNDPKFFKIISRTDRNNRLRIFEVLNSIEIHILIRLTKDPMTVSFLNDCLRLVQASSMEWLAADVCTDSIQPLIEVQTRILTDTLNNEEQLVHYTLTMIHRLYEYAVNNSSNLNIDQIHQLVFERVIPLAYMGHKRQRTPAIKTLNQALNTNFISYIKDKHSSLWTQYKNTLRDTYCTRMSLLVKAAEHDWANQWCLSIKMMGVDLHRGAELINNLLNVEEKAFKSSDMTVRKGAFESWKCLIDNFALDTTELATSRRIKLLCVPLNAKNSKIEMVAVSKLETWWHLIVKLYPHADELLNQVIGQFLNFCFGPLGDTPLLSTKCDVVASPGKRFNNTKLMALDALFQLLIQDSTDRLRIPCFIKERIPTAISSVVFQHSYKRYFHCVSEAVLVIHELKENELNNRNKLNEILWSNLFMYIQQSLSDEKAHMYKELLFIVNEVINHITDSSSIIHSLVNVIVVQLVKVKKHFTYRDTTLMDLLLKILSPNIVKNADKKYLNDVTHLISHVIKPENTKVYHPDTLKFIKSVLANMKLLIDHEMNFFILELWCIIAELMIKYMADDEQINEGTTINHNFEAIQLLITLPVQNSFWYNTEQITKIVKLWRELYIQFEIKADLIATVQPNEIIHNLSKIMEESLMKNKRCYNLIAHCLDALTSTINYEVLLSKNNIPQLMNLLRDTTIAALSEKNDNAIESSLKVTSSILITVYGLNQTCALIYLGVLMPSIEHMLEFEYSVNIEKEIIKTWEIVVIILRGLAKLLTHEFILSYQKAILFALRHNNYEISAQAMSLIDIKNNVNEEVKVLFDEFEQVAQNISRNRTKLELKNNDDSIKHVQITGSFLNRKIASPKTVISITKNNAMKKKGVASLPPPPEPDSQDYVVIKNDVKLDINRLTEHQKESLRRHRDDIPAMYNDLSQSVSHNTEQFENFFGNKSSGVNEEKNINETAHTNILTSGEANKENNITSRVDTIKDNNEKWNVFSVKKKLEEEKTNSIIETNQVKNNIELQNETDTQASSVADESRNLIDKIVDVEASGSFIPQIIPKKLNFTSDDELPNKSDSAKRSSQLKIDKSRNRDEQLDIINEIDSKIDDDAAGCQSLELLHSVRRGRGRGKGSKVHEKSFRSTRLSNNHENQSEQNLKRKSTSKCESERFPANKRRRYTTSLHSSSDTLSDPESNNSMEGDNQLATLSDENLPKRTKKEMSRLQINMVFNNRMPSKLRSKSAGDYIYDSNSKRKNSTKYSDKSVVQSSSSQQLIQKRKRKNIRSLNEVDTESLNTFQVETTDNYKINSDTKASNETGINDKETCISPESTVIDEVTVEKSSTNKNIQVIDAIDNTEVSNQDHSIKNSSPININCPTKPVGDEEEVVESSQKANILVRSPRRSKNDKEVRKILNYWNGSPKKKPVASNTAPSSPNSSYRQHVNIQTSMPDYIYERTSPRSIKAPPKSESYMAKCRGAHMLGLVTKLAIGEKNKSNDKVEYSEDEINKKFKLGKESDNDGSSIKKERALILKESDRIGSPSGSRQEKIFKNMKSNDYSSSPPSKLFSKLKNDGEKISPKSTKAIKTNHDTESCMLDEKNELPMLEWSNTNPPSLTASPSMSILKRQRQTVLDVDNDMTPSKRKRVSFADPPVSREMGYEVMCGGSDVALKFGQSRSLVGRIDTPIKIKQSKIRTIQIDIDNSDQLFNDTSNVDESSTTDMMDIVLTEKDILSTTSDDFKEELENCDKLNVNNAVNSCENEGNNTFDKSINVDNSSTELKFTVNDISTVDNIDRIGDSHTIEQLCRSEIDDSDDMLKFNITDDITRPQILNTSGDNSKSSGLEDTIDIQNISNLNSTGNSDELCCSKLPRTSTQINIMTSIAQCDTLPITDSMFLSEAISQDSLPTQQSLILSQPHTMDVNNSICPTLLDCTEPINPIVDNLVDPLWAKNLLKYFDLRGIKTIGNLAKLSEREVARFPVKSNSKVDYIKEILDKFSLSRCSSLDDEIAKNNVSEESKADKIMPHVNEEHSEILNDTINFNTQTDKNNENNVIADARNNKITPESLEKNINIVKSNDYGSLILYTSISPPSKHSVVIDQSCELSSLTSTKIKIAVDATTTDNTSTLSIKNEGTDMNIEDDLNDIDPIPSLQTTTKRNNFEDIKHHEMKQRCESEDGDGELVKDKKTLMHPDIFKNTEFNELCRFYGLTQVLKCLPKIFNKKYQFFTKVLKTYDKSIPVDDYLHTCDLNEVKEAICKKFSSSQLCEMLSNVLINEEENGIHTPLNKDSNLNAILKRMPVDSIISHTVTNNELKMSSTLLETALQNNNIDTIKRALDIHCHNEIDNITNSNVSFNTIMEYVNNCQLSNDKLLDIYRSVCDKLSPCQLLDAHNEIMKKKLSFLETDQSQ